jgi:hypothetical protein
MLLHVLPSQSPDRQRWRQEMKEALISPNASPEDKRWAEFYLGPVAPPESPFYFQVRFDNFAWVRPRTR